jgi:D-glycero-D-manno-heptose 1,7-bisphosphate phosphatase
MKKKAVFLDRDGTLNADVGYPSSYDQIDVFPESYEAVRKLNRAGLLAVVITNQSAVGRGLLSEDGLAHIHDRLRASFAGRGASLDAVYFCPHYAQSADPRYGRECDCRKPSPGLALRAAAELGIDLSQSYVIGDKADDIILGLKIRAVPVLVLTGSGRESLAKLRQQGIEPAYVADTVLAAADWVLDRERRKADDPV